MVAVRHPLIGLVYNDETGRYLHMLERKITKFQLDDLRFRCLLELLTGDPWDDYQFKDEDDEIKGLAVDALKKRLHLTDEDARKMVVERWAEFNPPEDDPNTATYLIGPKKERPHTVTHSRPIGTPAPYDVEKHLAGLRAVHERYQGAGSEVTQPATESDQA